MSKADKKKVCIVIPAYNEATSVGAVVRAVKKQFQAKKFDFTIVVVDDGSTDGTHQIAQKHNAVTIRHILNTGAGGATATGLRYAWQHGFDIAVTMDADGQHDPLDVVRGVETLLERNVDLLVGSRLLDARGMSRVKVFGNWGLSTITYLLFGIKSSDSQSGLRVFSHASLERLRWKTNGYEFCSEMLWRAKQLELAVDEYPIKAIYTEYSRSKGQNNWNGINIVKRLLKRRLAELLG